MDFYRHSPLLKTYPKEFTNFKYKLVKNGVTSGGSRLSFKFKRFLPINIKFKQLIFKLKNYSGRNDNGRVVMFTKSKIKRTHNIYSINYGFRLKKISFIASITILPYSHKLVSLIFTSAGCVSYVPTSYTHSLFKYSRMYRINMDVVRIKNKLDMKSKYEFITQMIFFIKQLPRNQKVSLVELIPGEGVKYIRSPGTSGHLLKLNFKLNTAFIRLPSKVRKVFSVFSLGSLGVNPFSDNKYWKSNKAGYYRNFGVKSKVRGIARNPIDHPHGGRTNTVAYPRTPWGKTTKIK